MTEKYRLRVVPDNPRVVLDPIPTTTKIQLVGCWVVGLVLFVAPWVAIAVFVSWAIRR